MSDCNCKITIDLSDEPCGDGKDFALAKFQREVQTTDFRTLKEMLKEYEQIELYEYCAIIQEQIDYLAKFSLQD